MARHTIGCPIDVCVRVCVCVCVCVYIGWSSGVTVPRVSSCSCTLPCKPSPITPTTGLTQSCEVAEACAPDAFVAHQKQAQACIPRASVAHKLQRASICACVSSRLKPCLVTIVCKASLRGTEYSWPSVFPMIFHSGILSGLSLGQASLRADCPLMAVCLCACACAL